MVKNLAVAITVTSGLLILAGFFLRHPLLAICQGALANWATIVAAFALLLGLANLLSFHATNVRGRRPGWGYSLLTLTAALAVLMVGFAPELGWPGDWHLEWVFGYVYEPLSMTFLALLAFFVVSAAYRALRMHTWESAALVLSAAVVIVGQLPLGYQLWPGLMEAKDWLLAVPVTAGMRGILLGAALGATALGLRVLLGLDRPYLE
ncbi:MAG: hypothetical protein HY871_03535 [Chloroflexi bacterium]|nr:hypothetical protein [Chloroflexota bacterium]